MPSTRSPSSAITDFDLEVAPTTHARRASVTAFDVVGATQGTLDEQTRRIQRAADLAAAAHAAVCEDDLDWHWASTGDGGFAILLGTGRESEAVRFARYVTERARRDGLRVRAVVASGLVSDFRGARGGTDYWGEGVTLAARMLSARIDDCIVATAQVCDALGAEWTPLAPLHVKDRVLSMFVVEGEIPSVHSPPTLVPAGDLLDPETGVIRDYVLTSRIRADEQSTVHLAFDRRGHDLVALRTSRDLSPEALDRLLAEAEAWRGFAHPGVCEIRDAFADDDGTLYVAMRFVDGPTSLEALDVLGRDVASRTRRAAQLGMRIVDALQAAHAADLVHGEVRPTTVVVADGKRPVLVDPGAAAGALWFAAPGTRQVGERLVYAAPERVRAGPDAEAPAVDRYALGALLFRWATGAPPFVGSHADVLQAKESDPSEVLEPRLRDLPPSLVRLISGLLSPDPGSRHDLDTVRTVLAPLASAPARSVPPIPRSAAPSFVVGRDEALNELSEAFGATLRGFPRSVFVQGRPGLGKTLLIRHFLAQRCSGSDVMVLEGRCHLWDTGAFRAFDDVTRKLASVLSALPAEQVRTVVPQRARALFDLFPALGEVPALAESQGHFAVSPDPAVRRSQAFNALRELFGRLCLHHRVVIFVDDLQWGDVDSVDLMAHLMRDPDPPPILLVVAYRSQKKDPKPPRPLEHLRRIRSASTTFGNAVDLDVGPLSYRRSLELLAHGLSATERMPTALADSLAHECQGHPYLLLEMRRFWETQQDGATELQSGRMSLMTVLRWRLAHLHPDALRLLRVVALAGQPLEVDLACEIAGLADEGRAVVRMLEGIGLATVISEGGSPQVTLFHDTIRDAVAAGLDADDRIELHRALAQGLELHLSANSEAISQHYSGANEFERAQAHAEAAARDADEKLAFEHAATLYRRSLSLAPVPADRRLSLLSRLAHALVMAGRGKEASQVLLEIAPRLDPARALLARRRAALALMLTGRTDEGLDVLRDVLAAAGLRMPRTRIGAILGVLARRLWLRIRGYGFTGGDGDPEGQHKADTVWAVTAGLHSVDPILATYFQTLHVILALRHGDELRVARGLAVEAASVALGGRTANRAATAVGRQALKLAEKSGNTRTIAWAHAEFGLTHYLVGEWAEAESVMTWANRLLEDQVIGGMWERLTNQTYLFGAQCYLGRMRVLGQTVHEAVEDCIKRNDLYGRLSLMRPLHWVRLANDESERARSELEASLRYLSNERYTVQHFNILRAMAHVHLYEVRPAQALDAINAHWPRITSALFSRIQLLQLEAHDVRGRARLSCYIHNHRDPALLRGARRDAAYLRRGGLMWCQALGELLEAEVALLQDRKEDAIGILRSAVSHLDRAQMRAHAAAARVRLGRLVGPPEQQYHTDAASAYVLEESVRDPSKLFRMLVPSLGGVGVALSQGRDDQDYIVTLPPTH